MGAAIPAFIIGGAEYLAGIIGGQAFVVSVIVSGAFGEYAKQQAQSRLLRAHREGDRLNVRGS